MAETNAKYPWAAKADAAFGHHSLVHRTMGRPATERFSADGTALPEWAHGSPRAYLANGTAWAGAGWDANASRVFINPPERVAMRDWAQFKCAPRGHGADIGQI